MGWKEDGDESVGHQSGRRIVELLQKGDSEYDEDDVSHMRKVVGYVHRHGAQGPSKHDVEHSKWRYSLMNWCVFQGQDHLHLKLAALTCTPHGHCIITAGRIATCMHQSFDLLACFGIIYGHLHDLRCCPGGLHLI